MRHLAPFLLAPLLFAALAVLPAHAGTLEFDTAGTTLKPLGKTPYNATLEAQMLGVTSTQPQGEEVQAGIVAAQIIAILLIILLVLRPMPSAQTTLPALRQVLAAAFARSRTRVNIARSPFDL